MLTIGRDKLVDYINYLDHIKSKSPLIHHITINKAYNDYIHSMLVSMERDSIYIGELMINSNDTVIITYTSEVQNTMTEIHRISNRLENLRTHIKFLNDKLNNCTTDRELDKLCVQMQELNVNRKN